MPFRSMITSLAREFDMIHIYLYRPLAADDLDKILLRRGASAQQVHARIQEHESMWQDYLAKLPMLTATLLNIRDIPYLCHQFDSFMAADHRSSRPFGG
jgi:hypothetical protein